MTLLLMVAQGWCPWCGDHMTGGGWGMMFGWMIMPMVILLLAWAVSMGPWSRDQGCQPCWLSKYFTSVRPRKAFLRMPG